MLNKQRDNAQGMTLLEMLFVMIGVALLFVMLLNYTTQKAFNNRIDRTVQQMQSIMVAAQAYYVKNNAWPTSVANLQADGYLPANVQSSFGGLAFDIATSAGGELLYISVPIRNTTSARAIATNISGRLPLSYLSRNSVLGVGVVPSNTPCVVGGTACRVVAVTNIPAQTLNSARRITYAGMAHHGGCVPVMPCPIAGSAWTPQIFVTPASASGLNDPNTTNLYSMSSFSAYATGGPGFGINPPACAGGRAVACDNATGGTDFWRVCLAITTEKGEVANSNNSLWGQYVSLMSVTRCTNTDGSENAGSPFTAFSR